MSIADSFFTQLKPPAKRVEDFLNGGVKEVSVESALTAGVVLLDVRTAEEFKLGSIPAAQSRPLFDNLERAEIGTIYKQIGHCSGVCSGGG